MAADSGNSRQSLADFLFWFPTIESSGRPASLGPRKYFEAAILVICEYIHLEDIGALLWTAVMPPGPVFNWLCVAHSAIDILEHAARYRAAQLTLQTNERTLQQKEGAGRGKRGKTISRDEAEQSFSQGSSRTEVNEEHPDVSLPKASASKTALEPSYAPLPAEASPAVATLVRPDSLQSANEGWLRQLNISSFPILPTATIDAVPRFPQPDLADTVSPRLDTSPVSSDTSFSPDASHTPSIDDISAPLSEAKVYKEDFKSVPMDIQKELLSEPASSRNLQSSKVPSSRLGRLFHYGGLAASLGYGAASELLRRSTTSSPDTQQPTSVMMTEANITRLVSKLSQMRGAALKLGQFMSIQDTHVLPPEVEKVFRRVQDSAHYMPNWQMEVRALLIYTSIQSNAISPSQQVMTSSLGPDWSRAFTSFTPIPFAAASIGQVHRAVLAAHASPTGADVPVAIKIQFPNIRQSVESDLGYMKALLTAGRLLPKGLFLDKTIAVMKEELADECDYAREASFMRTFGSASHLGNDPRFKVPWVWDGSTDRVLVMEHVEGVSVGEDTVKRMSQHDRDDIAARIIELCLKELFVFREMQTDPNWTNFLWNGRTRQIELVDFGATRAYSAGFIDNWLRLLQAAASGDRAASIKWSLKLGYLTGEENEVMLDAHVRSMAQLATPFREDTPQPFAFGPGSRWAEITREIREDIPVMLQYRLTPPAEGDVQSKQASSSPLQPFGNPTYPLAMYLGS
ncbi:hypothetical protein EW146_g6888 [Bondarzewia mesenterica]|uniref:ABC1 atypical kinase-like domain-containing protein n=1 Tax=Bondarzewia mesenterica TaxID=1095465 RepID=A0A4V3XEE5_9AGAM|nr:hypothetical protein EW146_g6888 [Bondarzewia mesenterica]